MKPRSLFPLAKQGVKVAPVNLALGLSGSLFGMQHSDLGRERGISDKYERNGECSLALGHSLHSEMVGYWVGSEAIYYYKIT